MDVHPTKNGIYRYWPIPISSETILTSFNIYKLVGEPSCNAPGIHGIHGRIQFHHGATAQQRNQDGPTKAEKKWRDILKVIYGYLGRVSYMSYVYIYKKRI